jgi:tetratricopeptide (TPR) repeat protein
MRLLIRHISSSEPSAFQVFRLADGKSTEPVSVPAPVGFPVEGRPNSDLWRELRWYLERFLDYPFPPETDHADRVLRSLKQWGQQAFEKLFGSRAGGRLFDAATSEEYARLQVQISSDDPGVLSWPWEALRDPEVGPLAQTCQVERRLNKVRDPQPLSNKLPQDRVNVLLVVARPYRQDVSFRSVARPLIELIEKERLAAQVELLRPPTFDHLRRHLRERPGYYHILHFDGHGAYSAEFGGGESGYVMVGKEGQLVFETEEGKPDPITAEQLSTLLRESAVPGVVLNACQSAMLDRQAEDPFASVAAALLRSGMRSVVAMAYALYVSGAQQFLPAFYGRLFEKGSVAEAVRTGRQQMVAHRERVCVRGKFPLEDWLVPVLYEQDPLDFSFAVEAKGGMPLRISKLPEEVRREQNPYGFIGRDGALLELERAMRRAPAGVLIQGLSGIGKTTLARGFLQWLDATEGLGERCFWFSFRKIRSAEYIFNRLGEVFYGPQFAAGRMEEKIEPLAQVLRERRVVIVWDNFESAAGIPGTTVKANLREKDRRLLSILLEKLRGGASKVVITSRSPEEWLGSQRRYVLRLGGLQGEERWEYCEVILKDLGLSINRNDKDLVQLMELLRGHPLAMRAILPQLEKMRAVQVTERLRLNLSQLKLNTEEEQALDATLRFVEQDLSEELKPLLVPVAMYEGSLVASDLEFMAREVDDRWTHSHIETLVQALQAAGLLTEALREADQALYELHPALTGYLRSTYLPTASNESRDRWARAFVNLMATRAEQLAPHGLREQRLAFRMYGANLHYALGEAERLVMKGNSVVLLQCIAVFARNLRNFDEAVGLYQRLLELSNEAGVQHDSGIFYMQLAEIALQQDDFAKSEAWYRKALAIWANTGDRSLTAQAYHGLGNVAQLQADFGAAKNWHRKALVIEQERGEEHSAGYAALASVALKEGHFVAAEQWYRKARDIKKKLGDHPNVGDGQICHQLGVTAQAQGNLAKAKELFLEAVGIFQKLEDERSAAFVYHQLGKIARERGDSADAEQWYHKALAIKEKLGDQHLAATTYAELGLLAAAREDFVQAGQWTIKAVRAFVDAGDSASEKRALDIFSLVYQNAPAADKTRLEALWCKAGLGRFPKAAP